MAISFSTSTVGTYSRCIERETTMDRFTMAPQQILENARAEWLRVAEENPKSAATRNAYERYDVVFRLTTDQYYA